MTTVKLIEAYGRRFTHLSNLAGLVAILVFGIVIAINANTVDDSSSDNTETEISVEKSDHR